MDVQFAHKGKDGEVVVNVMQIIQDDEQALAAVALPQPLEGLADVDGLAAVWGLT